MNRYDIYTSVVPSPRQLNLHKTPFYGFVHFGINTFVGKEWSDGTVPTSKFNPKRLDTDQWVREFKAAGMRGIILTAKHHDGFCLWQTTTTEYSIKNSPYKDGKGDIVAELAESCRKVGMKFGVYLSPWDRNSVYYGTDKYDDFYVEQLTELCTRYGKLFSIWLDGACGAEADGKKRHRYDYERIFAVIRRLQPDAVIANCGPDVRWVGNEAGKCRESEWSVLPVRPIAVTEDASQTSEKDGVKMWDATDKDIGSRKILQNYTKFSWYPAEVDVSITRGWFYHALQLPRSAKNLENIYYSSVGGNAFLLLNVPPDRNGLIPKRFCTVLEKLGKNLETAFSAQIKIKDATASPSKLEFGTENLFGAGSYSPFLDDFPVKIRLEFTKEELIDKILICEEIIRSQRVEEFSLSVTLPNGKEKTVYHGTTVGARKIARFAPIKATAATLTIIQCRLEPFISVFRPYAHVK